MRACMIVLNFSVTSLVGPMSQGGSLYLLLVTKFGKYRLVLWMRFSVTSISFSLEVLAHKWSLTPAVRLKVKGISLTLTTLCWEVVFCLSGILVILIDYRIDCINYFVHREMNLKNRTAHFLWKPAHFLWKPSAFINCAIRFFRFISRWTNVVFLSHRLVKFFSRGQTSCLSVNILYFGPLSKSNHFTFNKW